MYSRMCASPSSTLRFSDIHFTVPLPLTTSRAAQAAAARFTRLGECRLVGVGPLGEPRVGTPGERL
jgi:hypothetical protein